MLRSYVKKWLVAPRHVTWHTINFGTAYYHGGIYRTFEKKIRTGVFTLKMVKTTNSGGEHFTKYKKIKKAGIFAIKLLTFVLRNDWTFERWKQLRVTQTTLKSAKVKHFWTKFILCWVYRDQNTLFRIKSNHAMEFMYRT